jgi:hypothetical protein
MQMSSALVGLCGAIHVPRGVCKLNVSDLSKYRASDGDGCESARNGPGCRFRPPAAPAIGGKLTTRGGLHGRQRVRVMSKNPSCA